VLAPVKLWCDTATLAECAQITENFGGAERCIAEVGNPILPGYTAPKIRWLKNHRPEPYAKLATILLPHDYLNFHLTGEPVMECGDASGTGLLDIRKRQWHAGMLAAVDEDRDLSAALPPLAEPGSVIGQLRSSLAASRADRATLGQEAALLAAYLDILKVRMGSRLDYTLDIPSGLTSARLPPLTLQPLVENAIRHGLEPKLDGGMVRVGAHARDGRLVVEVEDGAAHLHAVDVFIDLADLDGYAKRNRLALRCCDARHPAPDEEPEAGRGEASSHYIEHCRRSHSGVA